LTSRGGRRQSRWTSRVLPERVVHSAPGSLDALTVLPGAVLLPLLALFDLLHGTAQCRGLGVGRLASPAHQATCEFSARDTSSEVVIPNASAMAVISWRRNERLPLSRWLSESISMSICAASSARGI